MAANYANVNAAWPEEVPVPTPQEALSGARRLVRLALTLGPPGKPRHRFRGSFKLTSGNRHTWTRRGVFYVNPNKSGWRFRGWEAIVHDVSHWAGRRLYPGANPHDARVAFIERKLAEHVVSSGWLDGKLKRKPREEKPQSDPREVKLQRVLARIKSWERKQRRAQTALRKLARTRAYYQRIVPLNEREPAVL